MKCTVVALARWFRLVRDPRLGALRYPKVSVSSHWLSSSCVAVAVPLAAWLAVNMGRLSKNHNSMSGL